MLRSVLVNLRDEPSALQGVLWSTRGPWLTLRDASLLKSGQEPARVDGEVIIHTARVLFLQVVP